MLTDTLYQNILTSYELKLVLSALKQASIRPLVLGGAALSELVYPELGLRPIPDIDLIVKSDELNRADNVLRSLGYQPRLAVNREEIHYHSDKSVVPEVDLDIQIQLWYLSEKELMEVWNSAREVRLNDGYLLVLAPDDMLIYTIANRVISHGFVGASRATGVGYFWLNDIKYIIERYATELDWSRFSGILKRARLGIPAYYVLKRASQNAHAQIPKTVLDKLKPHGSDYLEAHFWRMLSENPPINLIGHFIRLWMIRNNKDRLLFLLKRLFPSCLFLVNRYKLQGKEWLYPMFYVIRFIDYFIKLTLVGSKIFSLYFKPNPPKADLPLT